MNLKTNLDYKTLESGLLSKLEYSLYSPVDPWPESGVISASKLKCGTHFKDISEIGVDKRKV